jgi:hypothetical protein
MFKTSTSLPPAITDTHRQAAFRRYCWPGWTFDESMANAVRRQLIEARAMRIAAEDYDRKPIFTRGF